MACLLDRSACRRSVWKITRIGYSFVDRYTKYTQYRCHVSACATHRHSVAVYFVWRIKSRDFTCRIRNCIKYQPSTKNMKQPLIAITGGHLTPALAVIEQIQRIHPDWKMVFIGRRNSFEGAAIQSEEERLVRALGIPFHGLTTGRFQRSWSPFTVLSLLKIPLGMATAFLWLMRLRPSLILSFGGYIALPVVLAGKLLNVEIVTHEQTMDLGLSNRIIARMAMRVLLARDVGVPIRQSLFDPVPEPEQSYLSDTPFPILYITGGSTGAQSLNALIYPLLTGLSQSFHIIHQVGAQDLENARRVRNGISRSIEATTTRLGISMWGSCRGSIIMPLSSLADPAQTRPRKWLLWVSLHYLFRFRGRQVTNRGSMRKP